MLKYQPLQDHLSHIWRDHYPMTFKEIEEIIGDKLPHSAYHHRAWWSNNPSNSVITHAWLNAGWKTEQVDMQGRKLVFKRIRKQPPHDPGFSDPPPPPLRHGPHALTVPGLDASTLSRLRAKAELHGRSIEDMARDILARGAHLSPDERLALADRIRAGSPGLHDVDVVAMIREDRDSR